MSVPGRRRTLPTWTFPRSRSKTTLLPSAPRRHAGPAAHSRFHLPQVPSVMRCIKVDHARQRPPVSPSPTMLPWTTEGPGQARQGRPAEGARDDPRDRRVRTLVQKGVAGEDCGGRIVEKWVPPRGPGGAVGTRAGRGPYSCNQCSQRFPGIEVLERHRELNHTVDSQGSGSEVLLVAEVQMAAGGGRGRGDWWREQVEPFLTPDIVLLAAALGLAYGLATWAPHSR